MNCQPTAEGVVCSELQIEIRDAWAQFVGSAAQLIDEGLIPEGLVWPKGAGRVSWEANGIDYFLGRQMPKGFRGTGRPWCHLDHWFVRMSGRRYGLLVERRIERKVAEVAALRRHLSGPVRPNREVAQAHEDLKFRAFRSLIGLPPYEWSDEAIAARRRRQGKGGGANLRGIAS